MKPVYYGMINMDIIVKKFTLLEPNFSFILILICKSISSSKGESAVIPPHTYNGGGGVLRGIDVHFLRSECFVV